MESGAWRPRYLFLVARAGWMLYLELGEGARESAYECRLRPVTGEAAQRKVEDRRTKPAPPTWAPVAAVAVAAAAKGHRSRAFGARDVVERT